MPDRIDWKFIASLEGSRVLKGYVPKDEGEVLGKSGVTIATGFDIGQHSEVQVSAMFGAGSALYKKLSPFSATTGDKALKALKDAGGLTISADEATSIDKAVKRDKTALLRKRYDKEIVGKTKRGKALDGFDLLAREAQTVIASVAFQYGNLSTECPAFWRQVTAQDWQSVYANLRKFGDKYPTRRKKEAAYLLPLIQREKAECRKATALPLLRSKGLHPMPEPEPELCDLRTFPPR